MRIGMNLNSKESVFLLILYLIFVAWMTAETFGFLDLIPGLPPTE